MLKAPLSLLLKEKGDLIHAISPEALVIESVHKMNHLGIGALLVLNHDKLMGIISERDITQKIVGCSCDPGSTQVADIMTKELVTVTPMTTVQEAIRIVTERRFRHLPVMEKGKLVGLISIGDLTRWVMLTQENEISALTGYIQGER